MNYLKTLVKTVLPGSATAVLRQILRLIYKSFLVLFVLLAGWIVSNLVKMVVVRVLKAIKLDEIADNANLDDVLEKGGIKLSLSELIGEISYWIGILITIVIALNYLGLTIAADLLKTIVLYVPNIIAAIFIMIIGMLGATILRGITKTAAVNAGIEKAKILSNIVRVIVIVFAALIALEQLKIGATTINLIITIVLATLGLGLALAFGLGCKDIVARHVQDWIESMKK
jgi:hypothetical protein